MYFRQFYQKQLEIYRACSRIACKAFRFEYPMDHLAPRVLNYEHTDKYTEKASLWKECAHESNFLESFVDYKQSKGNFLVDIDGNTMLDLTSNGGLLALGYNHTALVTARASRLFHTYMNQSPNIAEYPPHDFPDLVRNAVLPVAPDRLTEVYLTEGIGSLANETAIKLALLKYKETSGGKLSEFDWDNYESNDLSNNSSLLQNNVWVLGFENGLHGKTLATLSASGISMIRGSVPTYDWPTAPMPKLKFPYAPNAPENKAEEDRWLKAARDIISERAEAGNPVGAIIIEPITFLGNTLATPYYYKQLQRIAKEHGIPFIVDETRTGLGKTGKMWAHEHWYLDESPDIVTFGTSAQLSGVFTTPEFRPLEPHKLTNISNGSVEKIIAFKAITDYIKRKNLLELVDDTGAYIKAELERVNKEKYIYKNLRGNGTFLGFDLTDFESTLHIHKYLVRNGIYTSIIGPLTIGIRPSLILEPRHVYHLRDALIAYSPDFVLQ